MFSSKSILILAAVAATVLFGVGATRAEAQCVGWGYASYYYAQPVAVPVYTYYRAPVVVYSAPRVVSWGYTPYYAPSYRAYYPAHHRGHSVHVRVGYSRW